MATTAQAAASLVNGALSHGPASEDAALYEAHLAQFRDHYQRVGDQELALVQSLADTHWRLARIPSLEMGIYALGRMEFADLFPEQEEGVRKQLIEAKIDLAY